MVRAKFVVNRIEITQGYRRIRTADGNDYEKNERDYPKTTACDLRTIVLSPVYANNDPKHENSRFWDSSPTGEIKLGTVNPDAWQQFELGKEYYIDFTPANQ
jgi:hypothetical protein